MKSILFRPTAVLLLLLVGLATARSESFSEPPVVIYGKVIQVGAGANYQLYNGDLTLTLSNESNASHVITKTIPLGPVGANGDFSYRFELPVKYLPSDKELADSLSVGHKSTPYRWVGLTVDGHPATPLDSSLAQFTLDFADRATTHRLDLKVSLTPTDTDGDGIPDWWEDQHKLNRQYALDAAADPDGDGLSNLEEFRHNTDPNAANFTTIVKTTSMSVPAGAKSGLSLIIIDQDSAPAQLALAILHPAEGLTWYRRGIELPTNQTFTYADVLAGDVILETTPDFQSASVDISLHDQVGTNADTQFVLHIDAFSPLDFEPAVWLHAGSLDTDGPISEWSDASGFGRDGYQPFPTAKPNAFAGQSAQFGTERFLYLDDHDLSLESFTAFLVFDVAQTSANDQTLFSSPELQLRMGGERAGLNARTLEVTRDGQFIHGPVIEPGQPNRITVGTGTGHSFLTGADHKYFVSSPSATAPSSTFTTIGGLQLLSDSNAHDFLQGGLRELVLFERALEVTDRTRLEDYQRSRWEGWLLWGDRDETLPLTIHGASDASNLIAGGWGDDTLNGGPLADILRGGPGANHLSGGAGADRFEFLPDSGNDTITDFSPSSGDVIDLTGLFGGRTGTPDQYINIRAQVTRGTDDLPVVNSLIELDYNSDGGDPDQVITLQGVSLGNSDLPRLVGEGTIQLGGPQYATSVQVTADETNMIEDNLPREIKVSRTGNLDAAMEVLLSFNGTATMDQDYRIEATTGTGAVRSVTLARGQSQAVFRLIPFGDSTKEDETVEIQALASTVITDVPESPLTLTLEDASFLSIQTLRHFKTGTTTTGQILITRTGRLDQQLEIPLVLGGNLVSGQDYEPLPASITLAPGEDHRQLGIILKAVPVATEQIDAVVVSLAQDKSRYALVEPRSTWVIVLPTSAEPALSYADWRKVQTSGDATLMAYLTGNDTSPGSGKVHIRNVGGHVELTFTTIAGLTDVSVSVLGAADLLQWNDVTAQFATSLLWLADGRVERVYSSLHPATANAFYKITARTQAP